LHTHTQKKKKKQNPNLPRTRSGRRFGSEGSEESGGGGAEKDLCELSCYDSWASALITELDQFKNEKYKQMPSGSVNIDLMDES